MARLEEALKAQLATLGSKLDQRAATERTMVGFYEGTPLPRAVVDAKLTRAWRMLMGMSSSAFASMAVGAYEDRLSVTGITSDDTEIDTRIWEEIWQPNALDLEIPLAFRSALICGRSFISAWPDDDGDGDGVDICCESSSNVVVRYQEGSRRKRVSALRFWIDDDDNRPYANLFTPNTVWKFVGTKDAGTNAGGVEWQPRYVDGENWPLEHPWGIPIVEIGLNRRLTSGSWGYAAGCYAHALGNLSRMSLLQFLGLIVAVNTGWPLRGVVGERISYDDNNQPIPLFTPGADSLFQLENPDSKLVSWPASDPNNLSIFGELSTFAALCRIPQTYLPSSGPLQNVSADTIRASEEPLVSAMRAIGTAVSDPLEELLRLAGQMLPDPVDLSTSAELTLADFAARGMAERADAYSKVAPTLGMAAAAELCLDANAETLARWKAAGAGDAIGKLLAAAAQPAPSPAPAGALAPAAMPTNGAEPQ